MTMTEGKQTPPFEIDILDPRLYDDPWETYRWLRRNAPIWWDEKNSLWVISRHEDISHISRNQELYSAAQGVRPNTEVPLSIITMDDPEHTQQRRLVSRGFTPRRVRDLADHIRELAAEIVDEISARDRCDFVDEIAMHVPLIVIAELMGLDRDQRRQLYKWSDDMIEADGRTDAEDPKFLAGAHAFGEYAAMCTELIEARRADGSTDDLIGVLTNAYDAGELERPEGAIHADEGELNGDDLLMFLTLLVVAGNETTRNALTGGMLAFSQFPEQYQRLLDHPELMDLAVEEIVRFVSPVMSFMRTVTEGHTYRGVDLRAGDQVFMLYQSANRDEDVFDDPDEFRVDRDPNPHLGFGIGTHFCMGANLARLEISTVFHELFTRLRDIRATRTDTIDRGDSTLVLALKSLPVTFTPERSS